jgi:hypothetical protein
MRTYRDEFPTFPALDVAIPAGFVDVSWHNDVCPSFLDESRRMKLWIDFPESEMREFPDGKRLTLTRVDENDEEETIIHTDDYAEVLRAIDAVPVDPSVPVAEFIRRLAAFNHAAFALTEAWYAAEYADEEMVDLTADGYPLADSFDEFATSFYNYSAALTARIAEKYK